MLIQTPKHPQSTLTHSKCYIVRVLHPYEWGLDPSKQKFVKVQTKGYFVTHEYNFWDYIDAWHKVFYYQNPTWNHSWLISLNPKMLESPSLGFPTWFYHIWEKIGPEPDILPKVLKDLFLPWIEMYLKIQNQTDSPFGCKTLCFFC